MERLKKIQTLLRVPALRMASTVMALAALIALWTYQISGAPIESDPAATVQMAANLLRHNSISLDAQAPVQPSMYREPLPVLTTAFAMSISDALKGRAAVAEYLSGARARHLKMQNVAWLLALCLASGWAAYLLTGSFGVATVTALLAHLPFYGNWVSGTLDSLYTEQAAAALLMTGSAALMAAVMKKGKLSLLALSGAAFGALALVKAMFLYVFAGLMLVLLLVQSFASLRRELGIRFAGLALLMLSFAAVLSPWLYRNWQEFGALQITERGGAVLFMRATKNDMNAVEYTGAFYVWAPRPLRPLVGSVLGFEPEDLMRGGPLQRLNRHSYSDFHKDDLIAQRSARPEDAISFYRKVNAERNKVRRGFVAAGHPRPATAADELLQQRAVEQLLEQPGKHFAATLPFLWRGGFLPFPLLACALIYALWRRRYGLALFVLPAFGMVMFYALLSHFILRYGVPTWPVALVAAGSLAGMWLRTLRARSTKDASSRLCASAPA